MPKAVSPAILKSVAPRRSLPGSAVLPSWAEFETWLSKAWRGTDYFLGKRKWGQVLEAGGETPLAGALSGPHAAAIALLQSPSPASIRKAPIQTLAIAERIVRDMGHGRDAKHPFKSLVSFVAAARGLADAFTVWARSHRVKLLEKRRRSDVWAMVAGDDPKGSLEENVDLRAAVAAADDSNYAEARALAAKARPKLDVGQRARIAYHFPDEPWGTEDLEAWLADPTLADRWVEVGFLLSATTDVGLVRRYLATKHRASEAAAAAFDLAAVLPERDALPLLEESIAATLKKPSYGPVLKGPPRRVAEAVAAIGSPEAARVLAKYASHPILAPQILAWFREHPEHIEALSGAAGDRSKLAATAERIADKQRGTEADARVAPASELPRVLRSCVEGKAPWRAKPTSAKAIVVPGLSVRNSGLERLDDELLATPEYTRARHSVTDARPMTKSELAEWRREVERREFTHADYATSYAKQSSVEYLAVPDEEGLAAWNREAKDKKGAPYFLYVHEPEFAFLVKHGVAAFPGWVRRDWAKYLAWEGGENAMRTSRVVVSPAIAPAMADVFSNRKTFRRPAREWLLRHPFVAAMGLVPDAVGKPGAARKAAEAALTLIASSGVRADVERAAAEYAGALGPIRALLDRDPLATDKTVPKRPAFLRRDDLPPVRLRSGAQLPAAAVDGVLDMLSLSLPEEPYAGIEALLADEACDAESLGALAIELLEQWVLGDAPGRFDWMGFAVVHLPSPAGHARLAALAREWSMKNQAKCERACVALAAIGSDASLMHLTHVAESTRFQNLRERATALLAQAAAARGLSVDELGDRTVPVVSADVDRKAHEAVVRRTCARLERLMITGRAIDAETFEAFFVEHPIVGPLVRGLVWETADGAHRFRVAEDRSYADRGDTAFALGGARVRLAHPARTPELAREWSAVIADYALIQPFEQIGRAVFSPTGKEADATALARGATFTVAAKKLLGTLESRGWRRDDAGQPSAFLRTFAVERGGELEVRLPIEPGFEVWSLRDAAPQKVGPVTFAAGGAPRALGAVERVIFSEIARDVEALRALA
ncbi:MAG: DUF4132 domain-containing protein [Polyangiaceae bacterium]